jgi:hypothetical protein
VAVDVSLVEAACLLHDVLRICDIRESDYQEMAASASGEVRKRWEGLRRRYARCSHEEAAYVLLRDAYPEVAETIRRQRYVALLDGEDGPESWEEKLTYYADMRVSHERVVGLGERLEEAHRRNVHLHGGASNSKAITRQVDPLIYELENEIFGLLDMKPEDVTEESVRGFFAERGRETG